MKLSKGCIVAIFLFILLAQIRGRAQKEDSQIDCYGEYKQAMAGYLTEMLNDIKMVEETYAWYDPRRSLFVNQIGVEYYLRGESAWFQMITCSSIGKLK